MRRSAADAAPATRNELIGWVAPPGSLTEAYTWPVTAFGGGIAVGSALAGGIVELAARLPDRRPAPRRSGPWWRSRGGGR